MRRLMFAYDLETAIMMRGYKREKGLILEISIMDVINPKKKSYTSFVNPFSEAVEEDEVDIYLQKYGANLKATKTHIRNIGWSLKNAKPLKEVLKQTSSYITNDMSDKAALPLLVAHNGRGFDHRILRGSFSRCNIDLPTVLYSDSLHDISKKAFPELHSHSLSFLHRKLCQNSQSFNWHTAEDDTRGLVEVIEQCAFKEVLNNLENVYQYICNDKELLDRLNKALRIELTKQHKITDKTRAYIETCFHNSEIKKNNIVKEIALSFSCDNIWRYRAK